MALPKICHALRRTYVHTLIERKSLLVERFPTGILVVLKSSSVGIAAKKPGKRYPWVTRKMRLKRGALLIPRMMSVFRSETIELFRKLGEISPPPTQFHPYGEGKLIPIYMYCDGWNEFSRMTQHILGEEGYGQNDLELGELVRIHSLIDQLEILFWELTNWKGLSVGQRNEIDLKIVLLSISLESALDPNKISVRNRLLSGVQDRLQRINPMIAAVKNRFGQRKLSVRLRQIEGIAPIIELRLALSLSYQSKLARKRNSYIRSIEAMRKASLSFSDSQNQRQLANLLLSTQKLSNQIKADFIVRPYRFWAHQSAGILQRTASSIGLADRQIFLLELEAAIICLNRIPLDYPR